MQPGRNGKAKAEVICFMADFARYRLASNLTFPVSPPLLDTALYEWRCNATCSAQANSGCFKTEDERGVANWASSNKEYDQATGFLADQDRTAIKMAWFSGNLTVGFREQDMSIIGPEYEEWFEAGITDATMGVNPKP